MDKLKHLIVLLVLINTQFSSAQQNILIDEAVFIHSNTTTLVSGETLLFKVYCLKSSDKTPSNISKVAYVELIDDDKKSVFKSKIALENAVGQGDYFIPTTLKTGNYKLIGYTNWMLNKPISDLFQLEINIVNPYKTTDKIAGNVLAGSSAVANSSEINSQAGKIAFKINKKTFTNRELVDLKVESLDANFQDGNYSLSVRKLDNIPTQAPISAIKFASNTSYPTGLDLQNPDKIILPELRGEMITGKISSKNAGDKIENISIGLSIPGKSFAFKVVKTDGNGNFIFNIGKIYYSPNIIIQIIDEKANNYDLVLNNGPEIDYSKLSFDKNVALSYTIQESLLERSVSSQIENAYFHKKVDNVEKTPVQETFYYPLAKEYILDDYTRFKTLKETITEVATEIYHKQKEDKTYLHVTDPTIFPQPAEGALVLVDGLYLDNQNDLVNYSMKNVYKIDVIVGRYYVGSKSFNGLINFTTFDKDFKSTQSGTSIAKPIVLRPQAKKIYNKVKYTNADNDRIPDFRNQLFWSPELQLTANSDTSFYTSDLSGTFEIRLEGFTKNGIPVSIKESIEVKNIASN